MNFQSESKRSGNEFEDIVLNDLKERGFGYIKKNVYMKEVGCEVDFIAYGSQWADSDSAPYGEHLGAIEYVESKGGKAEDGKRPGAQRTDNVKKAIANGALIKAENPDINFIVYFSAEPTEGSSSEIMLKTALRHKIINEVRYITNKEPNDMQLDLFKTYSDKPKLHGSDCNCCGPFPSWQQWESKEVDIEWPW